MLNPFRLKQLASIGMQCASPRQLSLHLHLHSPPTLKVYLPQPHVGVPTRRTADTVVEVISTWQTASTGSHYAFSFLISQFDKGGSRSALLDGVEHRDQQSDIIFQ
uniref:Uncharacterized protein n=1 Tax=Echinococcus granulosus TaxID=6210 RepID=U6FRD7_ECHGR|nr:hypothetical protein EgrG_002069500 [Echinococcus granulosus]